MYQFSRRGAILIVKTIGYRGITMFCLALKIYEIIIKQKLRIILDKTLEEAESGFRKNHTVQDHIHNETGHT